MKTTHRGFSPLIFTIIIAIIIGAGIVGAVIKHREGRGNASDISTTASTVVTEPALTSGEVSCYDSPSYFVLAKSLAPNAGTDILVKYKSNPSEKNSCEFSPLAGDFEIGGGNNADYFLALDGNFLILDSGTAPAPRGLTVYNLKDRSKVFADMYSPPVDFGSSSVAYWTPVSEKPTEENCPDLQMYSSEGLGAEIESHVRLDFSAMATTSLEEQRCSPTQ